MSIGISAPVLPYDFLFGAMYIDAREHPAGLEAITSWSGVTDCDISEPGPLRIRCAAVEATFLSTLGIQPMLGRNFTRDEPKSALVSYGLWRDTFGRDAGVIGRTVMLDGQPVRIAGVLRADFEMPTLDRIDLLVPQAFDDTRLRRAMTGLPLRVIGRLGPGETVPQLQAIVAARLAQFLNGAPERMRKEIRIRVRSLRDLQIGDARLASWVLLGAVFAVLLICCANVANLLLARTVARRRELTIRAALGAGRGRLIRQALTESLVLGLTGGLAGAALAYGLLRLLVAIAPQGIPRLREATLDMRVLSFTLGCSLLSSVLFGLALAFQSARSEALAGGRSVLGFRSVLRQVLVGAQIAVAMALVTAAGLLVGTLRNLQAASPGPQNEDVLTASIVLSQPRYPDVRRQLAFFEELENRLRQLPGISSVAISDSLPPNTPARSKPLAAMSADGVRGTVVWRMVTPEYFSALGIRMIRGRAFSEEDRAGKGQVTIVSESLARQLFPNEDPLGKQFDSRTVVGIVRNVRNAGATDRDDPE